MVVSGICRLRRPRSGRYNSVEVDRGKNHEGNSCFGFKERGFFNIEVAIER